MACARLAGADEKLSVKNELVLRIAIGFGTTAGQGRCDRIVDVGRHKMDLSPSAGGQNRILNSQRGACHLI